MNKKYWLVSLLIFILWFIAVGALEMWLGAGWESAGTFLRGFEVRPGKFSELDLYHYMVLPYVLYALGTVWLYRRGGGSPRWISSGAIFGFMIAIVTIIPMRLLNYTTFDFAGGGLFMPTPVIVKEMIGYTIILVALGVVIAWFHRNEPEGGDR